MALTTYTKNNSTTALNTGTSWVGGTAPNPGSTTVQALWTGTAATAALGGSMTWGQISVTSPAAAYSINATTGATLTLTPTDAGAAGVGIDMSSATQNFTVASLVALGSTQEWKVASGRTLTVSGVVSGPTYSLTKTDAGTLTLSATNTFGSGGGQSFTAAAGLTNASVAGALGSSNNSVVVNSGATLALTAPSPAVQTNFYFTGNGISVGYGAILLNGDPLTSAKKFRPTGSGGIVSFASGGGTAVNYAPEIIGTPTDLTINCSVNAASFSVNNVCIALVTPNPSLVVTNPIKITSFDSTLAAGVLYAGIAPGGNSATTTDACFGSNSVLIDASSGINYSAAAVDVNATLSRNYTFTGRSTEASNVGTWDIFANRTNDKITFTGTVNLGSNGCVIAVGSRQSYGTSSSTPFLAFTGSLAGSNWLALGTQSNSYPASVHIAPTLDVSGWTGGILLAFATVSGVGYGKAISNPLKIAFTGKTAVFDATVAGLTIQHSAITLAGSFTYEWLGTYSATLAGDAAGKLTLGASGALNWTIDANTLTVTATAENATTSTKAGAGNLALQPAGTNSYTGITWNTGGLFLNSAGAAGVAAATVTQASTGTLDNTSGSTVTLTATGNWTSSANFIWGGSSDLYRDSAFSHSNARTVTFTVSGSKTLRFANWQAITSTLALNVGGGATGTTSRLHFTGASLSTATTSSVTAGYLKVGNAAGLGTVGTTTAWTVSSGGCIELDGATIPATKNGNFAGDGPTGTSHGGLRSTSTTTASKWQGGIQLSSTTANRITAANATTLTLDDTGSPSYTGIDGPTGSSGPAYFDAGISATINVNRVLASTIGAVTCGQNGTGKVVLARANQHTGKLTCAAGTTALTNQNAAGASSTGVDVNAGARLSVEVAGSYKAILPGTTKLGSSTSSPAATAYFRIGA